MAAASPAFQPNVMVEVVCKAFGEVLSQALSGEWTVGPSSEGASQFSETPSLCFQFAHSGPVSGNASIEMCTADVLSLAQKFLQEEANPSAELSGDHKEAVLELLRQVAGVAQTGLKAHFGEIKIDVSFLEKAPASGQALLVAATDSSGQKIWIELRQSDELLASVTAFAPAKSDTAPEMSAAPVSSTDSNLDLLLDVNLALTLRFGQRVLTLREILDLASGSVIELDRQIHEPADLLLGDRLIARGEVVIVDGNYGIRVTEVQDQYARARQIPQG